MAKSNGPSPARRHPRLVARIRQAATALILGLLVASATVASSAQPAQADVYDRHSSHDTWEDCARKGDAGLNLWWVYYYCTADTGYDPKLIILMIYYP
jgi:hypothetical protein